MERVRKVRMPITMKGYLKGEARRIDVCHSVLTNWPSAKALMGIIRR